MKVGLTISDVQKFPAKFSTVCSDIWLAKRNSAGNFCTQLI